MTLQCFAGFCHTSTWISHIYRPPPSWTSLPSPTLPHPSRLSQTLDWSPCDTQQFPTCYLFYKRWCICFHAVFSICPTFSFTYCVHKATLHVCINVNFWWLLQSQKCWQFFHLFCFHQTCWCLFLTAILCNFFVIPMLTTLLPINSDDLYFLSDLYLSFLVWLISLILNWYNL